jgi:N6-L-threonylcarbamoyladenine synthase
LIEHKIQTRIKTADKIHKILPAVKKAVEAAAFDIQKIKNPGASGKDCRQGDQMGFWNAGEYVLLRDGRACHGRKGCKNPILNVHRIEGRKMGGGAPNNPAALCGDCHSGCRGAAFMGIMRWAFCNRLKEECADVGAAYGCIAKNARIRNG